MSVSLRGLVLVALLGGAALVPGACTPYTVVQQSGPPSALLGVQEVQVRFDWSQVRLLGKTEAEYLAEKSAEEQQDFAKIKGETDAAILEGLAGEVGGGVRFVPGTTQPDPATPSVVVQYVDVQTGIYTFAFNMPSKLLARFMWAKGGQVTDVIDAKAMVGADITTPSDHQRMEMAGRSVGKAAGRFLLSAQGK